MTTLWTCTQCGAPGVRNVYAHGYCATHLTELCHTFSPTVWDLNGVGLPDRPRPDHGPEHHDLTCTACAAGWVGPAFDPCPWCADSLDRLIADQHDEVLRPVWLTDDGQRYDELSDVDKAVWDRTRSQTRDVDSAKAWTQRIARAVCSDLITTTEAAQAVERAAERADKL